jgi:hypothetical protein
MDGLNTEFVNAYDDSFSCFNSFMFLRLRALYLLIASPTTLLSCLICWNIFLLMKSDRITNKVVIVTSYNLRMHPSKSKIQPNRIRQNHSNNLIGHQSRYDEVYVQAEERLTQHLNRIALLGNWDDLHSLLTEEMKQRVQKESGESGVRIGGLLNGYPLERHQLCPKKYMSGLYRKMVRNYKNNPTWWA